MFLFVSFIVLMVINVFLWAKSIFLLVLSSFIVGFDFAFYIFILITIFVVFFKAYKTNHFKAFEKYVINLSKLKDKS